MSEETETEGNVQPFVKPEEATTTDEGAVDVRGIPPGQAESIGAGQRSRPRTVSEKGQIPEEKQIGFNQSVCQEQSNGRKSKPVFAEASYPSMEQKSPQTKPLPPKHFPSESAMALQFINKFVEHGQNYQIYIDKLREERVTMAANSDKRVSDLLEAMWLVVEKDRQIHTAQDMQKRLREGLAEKDKKISGLEYDIQQRDKELEQVKGNHKKLIRVAFVIVIVIVVIILACLVLSRVRIT